MNVKGFILEDDEGREFVMVCEKPDVQLGRTFYLRGWQRRRLVPLQYSERELRRIVAGVLVALDDLFKSLPQLSNNAEDGCVQHESTGTPRSKKAPVLRKVGSDESCAIRNTWS